MTSLDTSVVATVKLAAVIPAATVTEAGTLTCGLLLISTTVCAVATGPVNETPAETLEPPTAVGGYTATPKSTAGWMESVADAELPAADAVSCAVAGDATGSVLMMKSFDRVPLATISDEGKVRPGFEELRVTATPPAPALALKVICPSQTAPPATVLGDSVKLEIVCALPTETRPIKHRTAAGNRRRARSQLGKVIIVYKG